MKITRRKFVKSATAGASLLVGGLSSAAKTHSARSTEQKSKTPRPNVVFILADDLGWGDLSCYGRPDYRTPNIDLLASQGTRFTDAYAASALCTPSRCGFVTGRYPARLKIGLKEPLRLVDNDVGLDPGHPTIASLLKASGYDTALIGKWHLGFRPEWGPNAHGFDEFFGILAGAGDYFLHKNARGQPDLYENLTPVERNGYLTEMLTERAVGFVTQRRRSPFFLSLNYTAPHWPWQGPKGGEPITFSDKVIEPVAMSAGGSLKLYAEMMRSLDDGVGRVMKALKGAGLDKNTLVIFTSDNGGERFSYQWPFSGQKGALLEGGIRVPAIVRWPSVAPANRVTPQMAISMDWTATILTAAETSAAVDHPLDGIDLLPVIKGTSVVRDRTFFWRLGAEDAVREGKWKYIRKGTVKNLFDLSVDEREQADFSKKNPAIMRQLGSDWDKWNEQMLPRPVEPRAKTSVMQIGGEIQSESSQLRV